LEVLKFSLVDRCAGAGHLRDDILYYSKEFEKFTDGDDEERAYLMDMGIKALRYCLRSTETLVFQLYFSFSV
jgi:hypothetical protein